jgi:hypothetical protein
MAEQKPSNQQVVRAVYQYAADLLAVGISNQEIINKLKEKGLDDASASAVVTNVLKMRDQAARQSALKQIAIGAAICLVGMIITVGTYSAASPGGGRFVLAWGAIIFGGFQFIRGLRAYRRRY